MSLERTLLDESLGSTLLDEHVEGHLLEVSLDTDFLDIRSFFAASGRLRRCLISDDLLVDRFFELLLAPDSTTQLTRREEEWDRTRSRFRHVDSSIVGHAASRAL